MKRIIFALALLSAPAIVGAQTCTVSPCSATPITTSMTVKSAVTFSAGSNLDFGEVAPGATASVDAQGTTTSIGSPGSVILTANQAVTITAVLSDLTAVGLPNLAVTSTSCGVSIVSTTSTTNTTLFNCATGITSPDAGTGAAGHYFWVGGTVATTATTAAGMYAGTATVTGTYTSY